MYISIIIALITIVMVGVSTTLVNASVYATTNSTSNVDKPLYRQIGELRLNPYFAPDESCDFDAYQLHCIPGEDQDCQDVGFVGNEDGTCHLVGDCPPGYHSAQDDESGQCYPDTEPCYPGQVRNQSDPNDKNCEDIEHPCKNKNVSGCMINGRNITDFPDEYCLTSPSQDKCAIIEGFGCPEGFETMRSQNFTTERCVPENVEELEKNERETKVFDPDRCAIGYKLKVQSNEDIHQRGHTIGQCIKED